MSRTITGQIVGLRKLHNSINGNPKYLVRIYKVDETIELRTKSDAGFAYAITERYMKQWATFTISGAQRETITNIKLDSEA